MNLWVPRMKRGLNRIRLIQPAQSAVHEMHLRAIAGYIGDKTETISLVGLAAVRDVLLKPTATTFIQATGLLNLIILPLVRMRGGRVIYYLHEPSSLRSKLKNGNPPLKSLIWHFVQVLDVKLSNAILVSRKELVEAASKVYGVPDGRFALAPLLVEEAFVERASVERKRVTYLGRLDERRLLSEFLSLSPRFRAMGLVPTLLTGDAKLVGKYVPCPDVEIIAQERFSEELKREILSETLVIWNPKSIPISQSGVTMDAVRYGTFVLLTPNDPQYHDLIGRGIALDYDQEKRVAFHRFQELVAADIGPACREVFAKAHGVDAFWASYASVLGISSERPPAERRTRKLIYIGGWGRSGSTVLGSILGSLDGAAFVGETRYLWGRGFQKNGRCGCALRIQECTFWTAAAPPAVDITHMALSADRLASIGQLPAVIFRFGAVLKNRKFEAYRATVKALYDRVCEGNNVRIVVDSSKNPGYFRSISEIEGYDVYFVHLIRELDGVVDSWKSRKFTRDVTDNEEFPRYSALRSWVQWSLYNVASAFLRRRLGAKYIRVGYEKLCASPAEEITRILRAIGEPTGHIEAGATSFRVKENHSVSGNPARFSTGIVDLKEKRSTGPKRVEQKLVLMAARPISWVMRML